MERSRASKARGFPSRSLFTETDYKCRPDTDHWPLTTIIDERLLTNASNWLIWSGAAAVLALAWGLPASGALNPYVIQILMYVGINMILTLSLNLVNGYMGEFSVGHAGFMGIGAYVASVLTVAVLPPAWAALAFPAVLIAAAPPRRRPG